jgi:hypothetical protein
MSRIKLPKGITVDTFVQTPANFDPVHADQETLAKYGHPRRPDESPEQLQGWKRLFGKPLQTIEPSFRVMKNIRHRRKIPSVTIETETSKNWSGAVAFTPTGSTFVSVNGQWAVPNPHPGEVPGVTEYFSSCWIGIGGDAIPGQQPSPDLFQAGVECDATSTGARTILAWSEWFPLPMVRIMNFPVSAGDVLTCHLSVVSTASGLVVLRNETQGKSTSFQINASSGTTLVGNCAEWIVERPELVGRHLATLTNYGVVHFSSAYGCTSANAVIEAGTGNNIKMTDDSGVTISTANSNGSDVTCTFASKKKTHT